MITQFLLLSIFFPAIAALLLPFISYKMKNGNFDKVFSFLLSLSSGFALLFSWLESHEKTEFFTNRETYAWLPDFSIQLDLALDGISAPLSVLYCIIFPLFIIFEPSQGYRRQFNLAMLLLCQSFCLGLILSLDLFFIFFFWTAVTLPVYFIMSLGKKDNEGSTGFHFIIHSSLSNVFLFLAFTMIYFLSAPHSFSLEALMGGIRQAPEAQFFGFQVKLSQISFYLFLCAVFFRVPIFLMNGWSSYLCLKSQYLVFALYSAVLVPVSLYLFFKVGFMLYPQEIKDHAIILFYIGLIGFIVGAVCTLADIEIKKVFSYYLLAHVSVILIGITSLDSYGMSGGVFHIFSLILIFAGLSLVFLSIFESVTEAPSVKGEENPGYLMYLPLFILILALFCSPGTLGFVSFSQVFMGIYSQGIFYSILLLIGILFITISGFSLFRVIAEWFTEDVPRGSILMFKKVGLLPLVILSVLLGLYPKVLIDLIRPVALMLLSIVK